MTDHSLGANRGVYHGGTSSPITTASATESGILRKVKPQHQNAAMEKSFDDLLIFGYACKIFRDDEKARYVDQGKHLIPWMGDNSLKIDRYDVRGALMDISQYEPPPGGFQNRLECLSSPERKAEQLCEQERYYSLYNNDVEEDLYHEEELKRLRSQVGSENYAQVAFNYEAESAIVGSNENSSDKPEDENDESPDEVYVPHPKFIIPEGTVLPETTKLHAIIEKTAKFIADQGPQMEILIKAKQSNNPQFEFLNLNSRLNPFYKHTLQSMQNDVYPFGVPAPPDGSKNLDNGGEDTSSQSEASMSAYFRSSIAYSPLQIPAIKYKPSADCAYTQLISKIKGLPLPDDSDNGLSSPGPFSQAADHEPSAYRSSHANEDRNSGQPLMPALIDQEKVANKLKTITKDGVEVKSLSTGLLLAQYYNSDSETDHEEHEAEDKKSKSTGQSGEKAAVSPTQPLDDMELDFPCPPEDLRNIIDKTAAYVLKNGKEFEEILRSKNDQRFTFLHYTDQYNSYYVYKVTGMLRPPALEKPPAVDHANGSLSSTSVPTARHAAGNPPTRKTSEAAGSIASVPSCVSPQQQSKIIAPVSFAIKSKEEHPVPLRPALPQEVSDSEDEGPNARKDRGGDQSHSKPTLLPLRNVSELIREAVMPTATMPLSPETNSISSTTNKCESSIDDLNDSSIRDLLFEQSTGTTVEEKKEAKRADDKVRDRLAQIAREKLGILSKEKQLQIERKKRAMAFLNIIKDPLTDTTTTESTSGAEYTVSKVKTTTATAESPAAVATDTANSTTSATDIRIIRESSTSSSDSVTFINIIPSTACRKNIRRPRSEDKEDDSDDVIEVTPRDRPRSSSRSRSRSSKQKRKHNKHRKKSKSKSKRSSRSRSRSRNSRDDRRSADYKYRKYSTAKSKKRRRRSSSD